MPIALGTITSEGGPEVGYNVIAIFTLDNGHRPIFTANLATFCSFTSKPNEAKLTYAQESDLTGMRSFNGNIDKEHLAFNLQPVGTTITATINGPSGGSTHYVSSTGAWTGT